MPYIKKATFDSLTAAGWEMSNIWFIRQEEKLMAKGGIRLDGIRAEVEKAIRKIDQAIASKTAQRDKLKTELTTLAERRVELVQKQIALLQGQLKGEEPSAGG